MIFSCQQVNKTFGFSHRTSSEVFLFWSRCSDDPSEIPVHHQQGTTPEWNVISVDWRWKLLTTGAGYPAWWADQRGKALSGLVRVSGETRDSADLFTRRIVWDRGKNKEGPLRSSIHSSELLMKKQPPSYFHCETQSVKIRSSNP